MKKLSIYIFLLIISTLIFSNISASPLYLDDSNITNPSNLNGEWLLSPNNNNNFSNFSCDESSFIPVPVPALFDSFGKNYIGTVWYRKHILLNIKTTASLVVNLSRIDDDDEVYFNGVKIGEHKTKHFNNRSYLSPWGIERIYFIPENIIKFNAENIISIKVTNPYMDGGFSGQNLCIMPSSYFFGTYLHNLTKSTTFKSLGTFFLLGFFLSVSIYHFFIYFFLPKKYNLYLAISILFTSIYLFCRMDMRDYLSPLTSEFFFKLDLSSVMLLLTFLFLFIIDFFQMKITLFTKICTVLNIIFPVLLFILTTPDEMNFANSIWYLILIPQLIYTMVTLNKSVSFEQLSVKIGVYFFSITVLSDILHNLKLIHIFPNKYIGVYGFVILMFAVIIAVSHSYMSMYREISSLNNELEKRVIIKTSELHAAQNKIIESEKLAAIGTLASGIAHELNSPLGAVLTATQLMRLDFDSIPDDDTKESMNENLLIIEDGTRKSKEIISQLLNRRESSQGNYEYEKRLTETDINHVIEHALEVFGITTPPKEYGILIMTNLKKDLFVPINSLSILQVFINILTNAFEALQVSNIPIKKINIQSYKDTNFVYVSFENNGIKIPEDIQTKIFDPFFTTKDVGSKGLGLTTALDLMKKHRGDITFRNTDNGVKFIVKFCTEVARNGRTTN